MKREMIQNEVFSSQFPKVQNNVRIGTIEDQRRLTKVSAYDIIGAELETTHLEEATVTL